MTDRPTIDPESRLGLVVKGLAELHAMVAPVLAQYVRMIEAGNLALNAWLRERPGQRTPPPLLPKRAVGHPPIDDRARLIRMAQLIDAGRAKNRTEAVRLLVEAEGVEANSLPALTNRLGRKFLLDPASDFQQELVRLRRMSDYQSVVNQLRTQPAPDQSN